MALKFDLIVVSGGFGKITSATHQETEASRFRRIMVQRGVEEDLILVEPNATNTGENLVFTRELLEGMGVVPTSGIVVTKPYMKRRVLATAEKQWLDVLWSVSGPNLSFDEYATDNVPEQRMIELMVGDLQRVKVYAERGFQSPQEIPSDVWAAYEGLVSLGYDAQVLS